jgi:hypothetical protein
MTDIRSLEQTLLDNCKSPYRLPNFVISFTGATRGRNSDCDPRIPRDHLAFCRKYPTETCVAGNGGV